jgi:hypothetical protein
MTRRAKGHILALCLGMSAALALILMPIDVAADAPVLEPPITLALVETDPVSPATLHALDAVFIHVRYKSIVPVQIWARAYLGDKPRLREQPLGLHPAGEGEAVGWFALFAPGAVDEIHLRAESSGYPAAELTTPVRFDWDQTRGRHVPAPCVAPLRRQEAARDMANLSRFKPPVGTLIIAAVLALAALGAFAWPVWSVFRWQPMWRALASVPLILVAIRTLMISYEMSTAPTSHNRWPFEYLIMAVLAGAYMAVIWVLRHLALRRASTLRKPNPEQAR